MKIDIYLGSYTKRASKGIHKVTLDTESKLLENLELVHEVESPTYLTTNRNKTKLFTVSKDGDSAGVSSLLHKEDGTFERYASNHSEGVPPCHVFYDEVNHLLFSSNYHNGTVSVYHGESDGSVTLSDRVYHEGKSVHPNQKSPHVHYSGYTPDRRYLLACDLGTDEVYSYTLNEDFTLSEASRYRTKPGFGPRHVVFHPNGRVAYVFGELSNEIEVVSYDKESGALLLEERVSTLPEDFDGESSGAAIRITGDGKFLYASNRGHNSLAIFRVSDLDQSLTPIAFVPTEGDIPRDFQLTKGDRFVVVAHQDSDNLTLFERNDLTGELTLLQKDFYAPECVCVNI